MSHSAFFYGTLMAPAVLHRVIHGTPTPEPWQRDLLTITPALLPGHVRHRVANADYPAVMPASGSTPSSTAASVRGTFVTGLTDGDIWRLDIFEGDEYARRDVRVRLLSGEEEGEEKVAQTYIWIAGEERLEKEEWDFDEFVREKMGRWVGGVELADVDDAVKASGGDPTGGRGANGNITKALEQQDKSNERLANAV